MRYNFIRLFHKQENFSLSNHISSFSTKTILYIKFLSLIIFLGLSSDISIAHDINDLHFLCLESNDYSGCIKQHINLRQSKSPHLNLSKQQWRRYGPLIVDWNSWKTKASNSVGASFNVDGKPIFIALNCETKKMNVTGVNYQWKSWFVPRKSFEIELHKDFCSSISLRKL